jgi:hypothetical protein
MGWKPGDCLLIETNKDEGGYVKSHLFVIILECEDQIGQTIIVNIQSAQGKFDPTTILRAGDHDFVDHDSYVVYRRARIITYAELEQKVKSGLAKSKQPLTGEVFQRLCEGLLKSPFTPMEVRDMYENYLYSQL